jgi:hypothetical protein
VATRYEVVSEGLSEPLKQEGKTRLQCRNWENHVVRSGGQRTFWLRNTGISTLTTDPFSTPNRPFFPSISPAPFHSEMACIAPASFAHTHTDTARLQLTLNPRTLFVTIEQMGCVAPASNAHAHTPWYPPMPTDNERSIGHSNIRIQEQRQSIPWIWEGALAERAVTLLSAPEKTGKTTLLSLLLDRRRAGGELLGSTV